MAIIMVLDRLLLLLPWFVLFLAAGAISTVVYRLYLHPLRNVPGPRIAAATWLYEVYFDLYLGGRFFFEIGRLHDIYGPIVRITPDEIHVNDPELIDIVYPLSGKKVNKDPYLVNSFGLPNSVVVTVDHDLHRLRRNALNRYFSKSAVGHFEPYIREIVEKLCRKIQSYADQGPITITSAFSCFTVDVITEYCFAKSYNFLDHDNFLPNFQVSLNSFGEMLPLLKQAPWIHKIMRLMPPSWLLRMNPGLSDWVNMENDIRENIKVARQQLHDKKTSKSYYTVIDELLQGSLPEEEKREERLFPEAVVLVNAAAETTTWNLSVSMFHLLKQPHTLAKLRKQLLSATNGSTELPPLATLEQLPYLNATVTEALRISYGLASRLPRIRPYDALQLHSVLKESSKGGPKGKEVSYVVPPGYAVSMSAVHVHNNPDLFPDPRSFVPERWLDSEGKRRKDLDKYILSFSKGTRQCLGLNLAYAEIFMCLAALVLRFGDRMELFETTMEDVELHRDVFAVRPKPDSKGIRVLVK